MNNTTEYKGNKLGQSIKSDWELTEVSVDHIENATANAMQFDFGWVPNSLISKLIWEEAFGGAKVVSKIEIPEWWANKNIA